MKKFYAFAALGSLAALLALPAVRTQLFSAGYLPHRYCYLAQPGLIWTNVLADSLIAASYVLIFACLTWLVLRLRRLSQMAPFLWILASFGAFILACAATHFMEVITVWWPVYPFSAAIKILCAAVSVPTSLFLTVQARPLLKSVQNFLLSLSQVTLGREEDATKYQAQIEAMSRAQMMITFNLDGRIVEANENLRQRYGYTAEELEGQTYKLFLPEEYGNSLASDALWERLRAGESQSGEYPRVDRQGRAMWVHASYNLLFDAAGKPDRVLVMSIDTTAHVLERAALIDQLRLFQSAVVNAHDAVVITEAEPIDLSGPRFVYVNPAFTRHTGYSSEEVMGKTPRMLQGPDTSDEARAVIRAGLASSRPVEVELLNYRKDGSSFCVELSISPVFNPEGRCTHFVSIQRDVTGRKQVEKERALQEQAIRHNEEVLERTGRLAGVGGWELDCETQHPKWSPETCRIFGLTPGAQPSLDESLAFYVPEHRERVADAVRNSIAHGTEWDLECHATRADGQLIWVHIVGSVQYDGGRAVRLVGAIQDVTALVADRVALEGANERLILATSSGGIGIFDLDLKTDVITCDARLYRMYGLNPGEPNSTAVEFWLNRLHPEDREYVSNAFQASIDGGPDYEAEFRVVWGDGSIHTVAATGQVTCDEQGTPLRIVGTTADISLRKQAEKALRDQASLLDLSHDCITVRELGGTIRSWNHGAEETYGYTSLEAKGKSIHELLHTVFPRPLAEIEAELLREQRWEGELEHTTSNGRRIVVASRWALQPASNGEPARVLESNNDITARMHAQLALKHSHEELQLLLDNINDYAILLLDSTGHVLTWSRSSEKIKGYQAAEIIGSHFSRFYTEEEVARGIPSVELKMAAEQGRFETEGLRVRKDGSAFAANVIITALRDESGKLRGFAKVTRDITVRKQMEADTNALLRTVHQHSIVSVADQAGRIVEVNDSFCGISGYSREELLGQTHHIVNSGVHSRDFWTAMWQEISHGRSWRAEICNRSKTGELYWVDSIIAPFLSDDGRTLKYISIRTDITAAKLSAERLRQETEKAELANRAKSQFLANMSHEVRTPLNAILGITHLAVRASSDPTQWDYLSKIGNASESLLSIVNDILDFSKMEAGMLQLEQLPFSLTILLKRVGDLLGPRARQKSIVLILVASPGTPLDLVGDALRLEQILINLVSNAIKFTESGEVTVVVTADTTVGATACFTFSVRDTGIGMSPEQVGRLFQTYNQADASMTRKYGGTGLGLAISRQLAGLMGGEISVRSELGAGSTFLFTVDLKLQGQSTANPKSSGTQDLSRKSVLIVEDVTAERDVLIGMLAESGFNVQAVGSGEAALLALEAEAQAGSAFDLVLLDYGLPGLNGAETARAIKANVLLSHIPAILFVSIREREEVMRELRDQSVDGFLLKPVYGPTMRATIAGILGQTPEPPLGEELASSLARLAGRTVLLVEDNEINREIAVELVSDLGILVATDVDGSKAVARLTGGQTFDLVLMDIQMPVMDGLTATRLIRADERLAMLPIIAMTAHGMVGDRDKSLSAGMNDHLVKPISASQLAQALLRWMPVEPANLIEPPAEPTGRISDPDYLPDELPGFDLGAALSRMSGKKQLLRKCLFTFRNEYAHAASELQDHLREGRAKEARRLAHSIKGAGATIGAQEVADAAGEIEGRLIDKGQRDGAGEQLPMRIDSVDRLEKAIIAARAAICTLDTIAVTVADDVPTAVVSAAEPSSPVIKQPRARILVVDDDQFNIDLIAGGFDADFEVVSTTDGALAIEMAAQLQPELILLDVVMPELDGYDVCRRLKAKEETGNIPVIFITAARDVSAEMIGLALGAVDYVTKPINVDTVRARVNNHILLRRAQERVNRIAAERLAISSAHLASIMDSTSEGIYEIGYDYKILYGNQNAQDCLAGFEVDVGIWACFPELLGTPFEQQLRRVITKRTVEHYEIFQPAHARWYKGHIFPSGHGASVFFMDVTSEKLLNEKLDTERILREKRVEAVSHMAGTLAHEINNPLAIIQAHADNLRSLASHNVQIRADDVLKGCDIILRTSNRAIQILRGLKGFASEGEQEPMAPTSIEQLIYQSLELQEGRFERQGIEIRINVQPGLPPLLCREVQIEQILTNLLNNAFDEVSHPGTEDRWVSISGELQGKNLIIEVCDSGSGIEDKIKGHLMDPFFTTKQDGLRMGIGLSLSNVIAQEHGGTLTLHQEAENTCFQLSVPIA